MASHTTERKQVLTSFCSHCKAMYQPSDKQQGQHVPRVLSSCAHSFCTSCLEKLSFTGKGEIKCPLCSSLTKIKDQVSKECPVHTTLLELLEDAVMLPLLLEDKHMCVGECQPIANAVLYCSDCKHEFCEPCFSKVHRVNISRLPPGEAVAAAAEASNSSSSTSLAAMKSPGGSLRRINSRVSASKPLSGNESEADLRLRMREQLGAVTGHRKVLDSRAHDLTTAFQHLEISTRHAADRVNQSFDELERLLKSRRQELMFQIENEHADHHKKLTAIRDSNALDIAAAAALELQLHALLKASNKSVMVAAQPTLTQHYDKVMTTNDNASVSEAKEVLAIPELSTCSKVDVLVPTAELSKQISAFVVVGTLPDAPALSFVENKEAASASGSAGSSEVHLRWHCHVLSGAPKVEEYELQQAKLGISNKQNGDDNDETKALATTAESLYKTVFKGAEGSITLTGLEVGLHEFRVRARNRVGWGNWSTVYQHHCTISTLRIQCCGHPEKDAHTFNIPADLTLQQALPHIHNDAIFAARFNNEKPVRRFHHFQHKLTDHTKVGDVDTDNVLWIAYQTHTGQLEEWCSRHSTWLDRQTHRDFSCEWVKKWKCCRQDENAPLCHVEQKMS